MHALLIPLSSFFSPFEADDENVQLVLREFALFARGRFVAQAYGEHTVYFRGQLTYGKAFESARSNALMRCCKDLGIASELWDPQVCAGEFMFWPVVLAFRDVHVEGIGLAFCLVSWHRFVFML